VHFSFFVIVLRSYISIFVLFEDFYKNRWDCVGQWSTILPQDTPSN